MGLPSKNNVDNSVQNLSSIENVVHVTQDVDCFLVKGDIEDVELFWVRGLPVTTGPAHKSYVDAKKHARNKGHVTVLERPGRRFLD